MVGAPFQFERTAMGEVSSYLEEHSAIPDPALPNGKDPAQILFLLLERELNNEFGAFLFLALHHDAAP